MSVTKKLRFEVFKRDSFTCQYCGRSAPDVVLECDHIEPVSKGGEDDILNLITSCFDCNRGKSDRELDDDAVLAKRKAQLDELQERREQIEMMVEWQRSLMDLQDDQAEAAAEIWNRLMTPYKVTDTGMAKVRTWAREIAFPRLCRAMEASTKYLEPADEDNWTRESVNHAFRMVPKIAAIMEQEDAGEAPYLRDCLYIRGIVRNRMEFCREKEAIMLLKRAAEQGISIDALKSWALKARYYKEWRDQMEYMIEVA